jgi:hypothetical protein
MLVLRLAASKAIPRDIPVDSSIEEACRGASHQWSLTGLQPTAAGAILSRRGGSPLVAEQVERSIVALLVGAVLAFAAGLFARSCDLAAESAMHEAFECASSVDSGGWRTYEHLQQPLIVHSE